MNTDLTPDQKTALDFRIAELCGVTPRITYEVTPPDRCSSFIGFDRRSEAEQYLKENCHRGYFRDAVITEWQHPPRYTDSLGAMHEAEKTLTEKQHATFRMLLFRAADKEWLESKAAIGTRERLYQSRSAAQRAIAFVLTHDGKLPF